MAQPGLCGIEQRGARATGGDCGRPQPAAQTCLAGAHRARLGGSAFGAAGGAERRCQPADGMAMATALCRERGRRFAARQDPQARQGTAGGGDHGADGGIDVQRTAAPGNPLDQPGDGQGRKNWQWRARAGQTICNSAPKWDPACALNLAIGRHRRNRFASDSPLEESGFEPLVPV